MSPDSKTGFTLLICQLTQLLLETLREASCAGPLAFQPFYIDSQLQTVAESLPLSVGEGVQAMMTLLRSNIKNRSHLLLRRKQCCLRFVCARPKRTLVLTSIVYVSKLAFLPY